MNFIHTENIEFSWGTKQILKRVSIDAEEGKFIGVIGPNGSGKSTFLKCVYRVWQQNGGIVYLDGKNTAHMSYRETALLLGVVAQHNTYDFDFSVKDVVLMGRSPHKKVIERDTAEDFHIVSESLEMVGLKGFEARAFAELSGGEQQRVILARALAQKTKGLILDEPTNHLDMETACWLEGYLKQYQGAVVMVSHDRIFYGPYCGYYL